MLSLQWNWIFIVSGESYATEKKHMVPQFTERDSMQKKEHLLIFLSWLSGNKGNPPGIDNLIEESVYV